jgi:hypothetical protein
MSKRNSILIILAIIILVVGGLLFMYFSNNSKTGTTQTTNTSNPFGNTSGNKTVNTTNSTNGQVSGNKTKNVGQLIQLYKDPTSGSMFLPNSKDKLRFIDRATGNTYEYIPENRNGEPDRITNTTIPKIQEAIWSSNGTSLVFRYLSDDTDNINNFTAKISTSSDSSGTIGKITGSFLASNIKQLDINPTGDKIFELVDKSDKSGTYGIITDLDGNNKKTVFDSPISYWNISWPNDSTVTFTTQPTYKDEGLLYFFNTKTYSMSRILGDITGMSTLTNKDAKLVAYSYSTNNIFNLDVYDVTNRISKGYNIATLADKCVWGNSSSTILYCAVPKNIIGDDYPDAWYQGLESFNDNIWKIDTNTGAINEVYEIGSNENVSIDAINLVMSPDDQYISFMNKTDLSLWLLQINK